MKKLLALFLFDVGALLQIMGTPCGKPSETLAKSLKEERKRLVAAFQTKP